MNSVPLETITIACVSAHAVTRYVQRVLGVVVPGNESAMGSSALAQAHSAAVQMSVNQVKTLILCPQVRRALALRASAVRTEAFKAIINPVDLVVVTINSLRLDSAHTPRKTPEHSRREGRRRSHQFARRNRAKHKTANSQP